MYRHKYLKYKAKYLGLQYGGTDNDSQGEEDLPEGCVKVDKYSERPSPPYHANDCKDIILKGNDENDYISVPDKNKVYHWKKLKTEETTKSAEEYFLQFEKREPKYDIDSVLKKIKDVKKELMKNDVHLLFIGWENVWNFIDYAWTDAAEMISKKTGIDKFGVHDKISFMFYTDNRLFGAKYVDGELHFQHNILPKDRQFVYDVFHKHFGKDFEWDKTDKKTIMVKVPSLKSKK